MARNGVDRAPRAAGEAAARRTRPTTRFGEACDAPGGYWLVRPDGDEVLLEPATAADLWAHPAELAEAR